MKLDVSGKVVLVSGVFSRLDVDVAEVVLKQLGATIADGLSPRTDYLFAGDNSEAICAQAQQLDVPIITEHALLNIIGMATRRRKEELFPSSINLYAELTPDARHRDRRVPLPTDARRGEELILRSRRTDFITSRRFGETWGLKLSEFPTHYIGELILGGESLSPDPDRDDVEHLYYCRFRSDGSDYASGSEKFGAEHGFHSSWILECLEAGLEPVAGALDHYRCEDVDVSWSPVAREGEDVWCLKLSTMQSFGHVQAEEYEELVLDLARGTWRWSHYFLPCDADI